MAPLTLFKGGTDSGKSTSIQQMHIMPGSEYDSRRFDRPPIYEDLLYVVQKVIISMREHNLEPVDHRNQEYSDYLMKHALTHNPIHPLDPKFGDAMCSLWKDESMKNLMEHRTKFRLPESTS
jgi:hypothetical protein